MFYSLEIISYSGGKSVWKKYEYVSSASTAGGRVIDSGYSYDAPNTFTSIWTWTTSSSIASTYGIHLNQPVPGSSPTDGTLPSTTPTTGTSSSTTIILIAAAIVVMFMLYRRK